MTVGKQLTTDDEIIRALKELQKLFPGWSCEISMAHYIGDKTDRLYRFDKGHYSYACERGLSASGSWENRPRYCGGVCCGRELVEQSTLDAAIEKARASDFEQLVRLREAAALLAIPYEALLLDAESRKWIAPEVWAAIENSVTALRNALGTKEGESNVR